MSQIQVRLIPMDPGQEDTGYYIDCTECGVASEPGAIGIAADRDEGDTMALEHMADHGIDVTPWTGGN